MHVLLSGIGASLDSFLVCVAVGSQMPLWRDRLRLSLVFGICDAAAALLGSFWQCGALEPQAIAIYLLCATLIAQGASHSRALLYAAPLLLSIDNLFGGNAESAPVFGLGSFAMALCGLSVVTVGQRALLACVSEV